MYDVTFRLKGLACEACQKLAKKKLEKIPGVSNACVAQDGTTVLRASFPPTSLAIDKALTGTGFEIVGGIR